MTGAEARESIRSGRHRGPTAALALRYVQANLVAVPEPEASHFRLLCARNPVPCPLLEEIPRGCVESSWARGSDIRIDVPGYRLWRAGAPVERFDDAREIWREDLVTFLIGCSYTFEWALAETGLPSRHASLGLNVPMYRTNVPLAPAGPLRGHMVVSMRPYPEEVVERVRAVTRPYVEAHGEPFAWGDPGRLGIRDLARPDEGDAVPVAPGEIPVFWGCGVTPQVVAVESGLEYVITHEPGRMFVTDRRHEDLRPAELH